MYITLVVDRTAWILTFTFEFFTENRTVDIVIKLIFFSAEIHLKPLQRFEPFPKLEVNSFVFLSILLTAKKQAQVYFFGISK